MGGIKAKAEVRSAKLTNQAAQKGTDKAHLKNLERKNTKTSAQLKNAVKQGNATALKGALKDAKKGLKDAKKGAEKFKTHTEVKIAKAKKEVARQKAKAKNIERANKAAKKKLSFLCSAWAKQGLCKAKSSYKAFMFNECCDEC